MNIITPLLTLQCGPAFLSFYDDQPPEAREAWKKTLLNEYPVSFDFYLRRGLFCVPDKWCSLMRSDLLIFKVMEAT
jgi:hypothetical protein